MKLEANSRTGTVRATMLAAVSVIAISTSAFAAPKDKVQTFYQSGQYTYCDAKQLSAFWGISTWDAKVRAGGKLQTGGPSVLNWNVKRAQALARQRGIRCDYSEGGYSYKDAVALAKYWGYKTPWDAKLKMGRLLANGGNLHIRRALRAAR